MRIRTHPISAQSLSVISTATTAFASNILIFIDILTWRVSAGAVFSPILEAYQKQINAYSSGMRAPDRQMLELESYSIHASNEYVLKLGLDTSYMNFWRRPNDYIVDVKFKSINVNNADEVMSVVSSSTTRASTAAKTFVGDHYTYDFHSLKQHTEDQMYKGDMEDLLNECQPALDKAGNLVRPSLLAAVVRWAKRILSRCIQRAYYNEEIRMAV